MRSDPQLVFSQDFEPDGLGLPGRHFQDGVSQSGKERNHLFLNDQGRAFHDVSGLSGLDSSADGRSFAWLDFDRDGLLDLATVNANAPLLELYHNEMGSGPQRNFIVLELIGGHAANEPAAGASTRSAIGSRVEVDAGDRTLVRELRAGEGLAAQNSARMLIGIGAAERADEIRILWPSGRRTTLSDLPSRKRIVVRELPRQGESEVVVAAYDPAPSHARLSSALQRASAYLGTLDHADPSWRGIFGYLQRRFGFELKLASGRFAHEPAAAGTGDPVLRGILARMDDATATADAATIAAIPSQIDRMTAVALHCDRLALPGNWAAVLEAAGRAGGYALTHAALASQWSVENGCLDAAEARRVQDGLATQLATLIQDRERLAATDPKITDVWIEAAGILTYIGHGQRVTPDALGALLAQQRSDGGWPLHPTSTESDPHATAVAIWALLEALHPERGPSPWLPRGGLRSLR